jgi:hypothetical protein
MRREGDIREPKAVDRMSSGGGRHKLSDLYKCAQCSHVYDDIVSASKNCFPMNV